MDNKLELRFEELEVQEEMFSDFVNGVCDGFIATGTVICIGALIFT